MTSRECQIALTQALEDLGVPIRMFSADLFRALTEAQEGIYRTYAQVFEETRVVTDLLQSLVIRGASLDAAPGDDATHGFYIDRFLLPDDFGYYLTAQALVAYHNALDYEIEDGVRRPTGSYNASRRLVRHVQTDDILRVLDDPFSRPSRFEPVATTASNKISLYLPSGTIATRLYLDYLRQPPPITPETDPALPEREHPRLITAATQLLVQRLIPQTNE